MSVLGSIKASVKRAAGAALPWKGIVGLNYHRIGDGTGSSFDRGLWSATPEGFDRQLRWLRAHFDVVSPRDISYVLRVRRGRHVVVTFDDGYEDNFRVAYPILRAHRAPAAFFVATGYVDHPRLPWWDEIASMVRGARASPLDLPGFLASPVILDEPGRECAVRTLLRAFYDMPEPRTEEFLDAIAMATGVDRDPEGSARGTWMTWDALREMHAGGMTIGGHTVHHPVLARLPRERQAAEIDGCASRLQEEIGVPMRSFAYPVGRPDSFNADTRACLQDAGVRAAFSYYGGFRSLDQWDDYDIRRVAVEQDMSFDEFRAVVSAPWLGRP